MSLSINWHNHSTSSSIRSFSKRHSFLLFKSIRKLNSWKRLLELFGKAFTTFLKLLYFTDLLGNEDSAEFRIWLSFDLFIRVRCPFFLSLQFKMRLIGFQIFHFHQDYFVLFPQGIGFAIFPSLFFSVFLHWQWCHCLSVKMIS